MQIFECFEGKCRQFDRNLDVIINTENKANKKSSSSRQIEVKQVERNYDFLPGPAEIVFVVLPLQLYFSYCFPGISVFNPFNFQPVCVFAYLFTQHKLDRVVSAVSDSVWPYGL